jgi:predicted nucleotidyltransferase
MRLGYFGSLAVGTFGVGSDLDIVAILRDSPVPFERRAVDWDVTLLPVAVDLLVYTQSEWQALTSSGTRFGRMLAEEVVWIISAGG